MLWLLFALLSPIMHGWANVLDNYFANRIFKTPLTLLFFSSLTNLIFIPLIFLIEVPTFPTLSILPYLILLGITGVAFAYPYYKALQLSDTSVVTSLFSLGRVFVPILAFLIVGEVLTLQQYIGFFAIIISGVALSFDRKKFKINAAFFYMLACSIIIAIEAVIYKFIFESVSWSTGFVWPIVFSFAFTMFLLLIKKRREEIKKLWPIYKKQFKLFSLEEFLTFCGSAAETFAIFLAPVTLVKGVVSIQPFLVLIYAIIFGRFFPKIFRENIDVKSIAKKIFFFFIIILGIYLIVR